MIIKEHKGGWGVWRDEHSSTYALPVTWSADKDQAVKEFIKYETRNVNQEYWT